MMRITILLLSFGLTISPLTTVATSLMRVNTEIAENVTPQAKDPIVPPYRRDRTT